LQAEKTESALEGVITCLVDVKHQLSSAKSALTTSEEHLRGASHDVVVMVEMSTFATQLQALMQLVDEDASGLGALRRKLREAVQEVGVLHQAVAVLREANDVGAEEQGNDAAADRVREALDGKGVLRRTWQGQWSAMDGLREDVFEGALPRVLCMLGESLGDEAAMNTVTMMSLMQTNSSQMAADAKLALAQLADDVDALGGWLV